MLPGKNAPTHIAASGCQLPKAWSRSSVFSLLCSSPAHSHRHFQLGELRPAALTRANNPGDTQGNPPQALPCHRPATWFVGAKNRGGGSVFVLGTTRPPVAGTSTSGAMPLPSWEQPAMKSEGLLGAGDSQGEKVWVVVQAAERVTVCGKSFHKDTEPKLRLCLTHHGVTSWGGWRTSTY